MRGTAWKLGMVGLLAAVGAMAQTAERPEPKLSAAETAIVNRQIETLKDPGEQRMAQGWSNAKKMAEMICRPAALHVLKKQDADVDKVFLGMDGAESLTLESDQRLTGSGEFRTPQGWKDFSFTCEVNAETGKVTNFQHSLVPAHE
ncbi:MAG TPA: DUF930 domain-containing protein [Acidobacteriaceae bacterium]|jgi:hypothetical protein|nr:DUF930 domain-containing protein [Acidobacteriaceae bacterium]